MESDKTILLPLDGSDNSLTALLPARSIAALLDLHIHIIHISEGPLSQEEIIQKIKINPEELPRFIINHKSGDPAQIILDEAKSASYIVMCTHGTGSNKKELTGDVATKVVENSNIPVLLVRPDTVVIKENDLWKPKRVLMPVNGSPGSAQALDAVIEIVKKTAANIDVMHIFTEKTAKESNVTAPYYEDYPQHEWPFWSKEFLKRFCPCFIKHVKINLSLSTGDPAKEIISFARENSNDLIVLAWHGKLFPPHAYTLRKIIEEVPCPILLTRIVQEIEYIKPHPVR